MAKLFKDFFDVADALFSLYFQTLNNEKLRSGFIPTGIWNPKKLDVDFEVLAKLFCNTDEVRLNELLSSSKKRLKTLVQDCDVELQGTFQIRTKYGAHVTNEDVLEAFALSERKETVVSASIRPLMRESVPVKNQCALVMN